VDFGKRLHAMLEQVARVEAFEAVNGRHHLV
jgi:hypothetical protein